jgi:branched-chain amino acid aminotransferase
MAFLFYFQRMNFVCLSGKILPADKPVLMADNRGYRYGDGIFETMKLFRGQIILQSYHFERLFAGLALLRFNIPSSFTKKKLLKDISVLYTKNRCGAMARVRLSVSRGNGGLYDDNFKMQYLIECWPASGEFNGFNKNGLRIDIFPQASKNCDAYSNLKSANYLPYTMAAQYAKANQLDDCLLNNVNGRVADATIANIFLVKNNLIITPALTEGCVSGVMRRYLIEKLRESGVDIREGVVTKNDMDSFDEAFLTNAMYGLRWIHKFRNKKYTNTQTLKIFKEIIEPLYS